MALNQNERRKHIRSREQIYGQTGMNLALQIQERLGVELALIINPVDLTMIGTALYDPEETIYQDPSVREHAEEMLKYLTPNMLRRTGISKDELINRYLALLGYIPGTNQADYATGEVANALINAPQIAGEEEIEAFKKEFAHLMTYSLIMHPTLIGHAGVRINNVDQDTAIVTAAGANLKRIKPPKLVIEYGPGLTAFEKLPAEVAQTPRTIFIERNRYVNEALLFGALLQGLSTSDESLIANSQVIGSAKGMKTATEELLALGFEGTADVIINSRTYTAGDEEMTAGIRNGYRLLKKGGLFIVQAVNEVNPGEVSGRRIFSLLQETFRKQPDGYRGGLTGIFGRTKERRTGYNAIFVK